MVPRRTQFSGAVMALDFGRQTGADSRTLCAWEQSTDDSYYSQDMPTIPVAEKLLCHSGLFLEMCVLLLFLQATARVVCPPHPFLVNF